MSKDERNDSNFCCPVKEFFSKESKLVSFLEITPRIVFIKKPLKPNQVYSETIEIKNKGIYARSLKYRTDSDDMQIKIHGIPRVQYLTPNFTIVLEVIISTSKHPKRINHPRRIFIDAEHPYVTFDIPIYVLPKSTGPLYPDHIEFPRSLPKSFTFYELIIYNASKDEANFNTKSYSSVLTVFSDCKKLRPKEFAHIFLKLKVKDKFDSDGAFKVRFGPCVLPIAFKHKPKTVSLYVSTPVLRFEETKFERSANKSFTVCNEGDVPVPFSFEFEEGFRQLSLGIDSGEAPKVMVESVESTSSVVELAENPSVSKMMMASNQILSNIRKNDNHYFRVEPKRGEFPPNSCTRVTAIFNPNMISAEYENDASPPYAAEAEIKLLIPNKADYRGSIVATGTVDGPDVYVSPKSIDFRQVYLGEEHCEQIRMTNVDGIVDCEVSFFDHSGASMAKVFMSPNTPLNLRPCQQDIFHFTFYTIIVGKVFFKLRFKVKNGGFLVVVVRADSQPVRVKPFPELVEFGSVPFGVPQKRQVLLMNPLSVPISLQCFAIDNGVEIPLVLKVDNVDELPPIDIKNPIGNLIAMQYEDEISAYSISDLSSRCPSEVISYNSAKAESDAYSFCSSKFRDEVLEPIEDIALKVVSTIKAKRIPEKNEPEAKILRTAADELLALPYFQELTRYNNYACMDWEAIPSDPCEMYFDSEIIHLKPNAGHSLTVVIIPNTVGYFNRAINVRCCPHINKFCETEDYDAANASEMLCESSLLITKLYVEYNCRIPHIKWENEIHFDQREMYAMQIYDFEIDFENQSNIGGFLHFVLVPDCENGVMRFRNNCWKFFIASEDYMTAFCSVEFKRTGDIALTGLVKILGHAMGIPFHLSAHVLPTRVVLQPRYIYKRQEVLETSYVTVFITNITPTVTSFILSLRDDSYQSIDTHGAQLGPNGQGTYVVIRTMYPDPEVYRNILYVDMLHGRIMEVPLTYNITGMPIFFDPDLRRDFDAGTIILSSEKDYETRTTNFSKIIRIWNEGERPYAVNFHKIKGNSETSAGCMCCSDTLRAQFFITPKTVVLYPGGAAYAEITAVGCQEAMIYSEYRITIIDQTDAKRFANIRFVLKGKFAQAELVWEPHTVRMTYNKTHKFLEHPQLVIVKLTNKSNAVIKNVRLGACGPFKIKETYEKQYTKKLCVDFEPLESKEITLLLSKSALEGENLKLFPTIKGQISVQIQSTMQKSLPILLKINYPDIVIVESEVVLFTGLKEDFTEILIENVGLLDAHYKWKKLGETEKYVGGLDDSYKIAQELLNDILRMLELHEEYDFSHDPICQRNLTWCYQKFRCILLDTPIRDPIGVRDIIDDIIACLDLEHKRYTSQTCDDVLWSNTTDDDDDSSSAEQNVKKTIDKVVGNLKLEDSFTLSEPSEEECEKNEHIYFCAKEGVVNKAHGARCLLHLPPVREGYAITAEYELDVVGGKPQRFTVTAANLERIVEIIPESLYLGVRPWYEFHSSSVDISNMTGYRISVEILEFPKEKPENLSLVHGYADIISSKMFFMKPYCIRRIRSEGILGFSDEFIRDIQLNINDRHLTSFRLRGQGIMPLLLATGAKTYPRIEQSEREIIEDYKTLQQVYYFTMFKDITFVDEDLEKTGVCEEEGGGLQQKKVPNLVPSFSQLTELSDSDEDPASMRPSKMIRIQRNWDLLMSTYVIAYKDSNLPDAVILEQLMNMVTFKNRLITYPSLRDILSCIYYDHLKMLSTYDEKMPINLKYFTVQPLPYQQLGYIIEMTDLKLNQFRRYQIELQFLGPGKLIASARTAVKIPGLYVHFEVYEKGPCDNFELYRADEKMPDFFVKKYRNMWERQIDADMDPKLHQAHSFDCEDRCGEHKRERIPMTAKVRRDINNYYSSLNKSCYLQNKHHFTNCTIFAKCKDNFSGTLLRMHVLLKPDEKYFTEGQVLEDFLFIDLHMGPTLPILMRGLIK